MRTSKRNYGYALLKHPRHFGDRADELQDFLDQCNEKGYVIVEVVPSGDGYITVIYLETGR